MKLIETFPVIDVFSLEPKDGEGAGLALATGIQVDGQAVELRPHPALPLKMFVCPDCNASRYRLSEVDGRWSCRECHQLDWSSRHRNRRTPFNRIIWLRGLIDAGPPFEPIPRKDWRHRRFNRIRAEIHHLEGLMVHALQRENDALEKAADKWRDKAAGGPEATALDGKRARMP